MWVAIQRYYKIAQSRRGGYHPPAKNAQFYSTRFVGVGDPDDPLTRERHGMNLWDLHPTFASYHSQTFYIFRVSAFSFYLKKKTPAKEKQTQGCAPRPRERRAAVHSSWLSISCSAHSHANAPELERVRARASCFASRSLALLS